MATLSVTTRGQVTFRRDVLRHMGIEPGGKIEVDLLPGGQVTLRAPRPKGSIENFFGCLAGLTDKVATIEEMNEAIEKGWAGELEDRG